MSSAACAIADGALLGHRRTRSHSCAGNRSAGERDRIDRRRLLGHAHGTIGSTTPTESTSVAISLAGGRGLPHGTRTCKLSSALLSPLSRLLRRAPLVIPYCGDLPPARICPSRAEPEWSRLFCGRQRNAHLR